MKFVETVFGDNGLASINDVASFESKLDRLRGGILTKVSDQLSTYFKNR